MTGTHSLLADLLADCEAHGIRLTPANGDGLNIDAPQDTLTPDLLARLKAHKVELLTILRGNSDAPATELTDATQLWKAVLNELDGDPLFPPEMLTALRAADARWAGELD
ncbi:MAG: hypothetical protein O3C34_16305 [Proteobacteria bacterium]|nr:hypothetical protein [Pseudomonadota bacterium]